MRTLSYKVLHDRAGSALYTVLVLSVFVIQYGSMFELVTDRKAPEADSATASDAAWYTIVTITTVGYGDKYPVTDPGRIVGVLIMVVGVGLFGVLTGFPANAFLSPSENTPDEKDEEQSATQQDQDGASLPAPAGFGASLD